MDMMIEQNTSITEVKGLDVSDICMTHAPATAVQETMPSRRREATKSAILLTRAARSIFTPLKSVRYTGIAWTTSSTVLFTLMISCLVQVAEKVMMVYVRKADHSERSTD